MNKENKKDIKKILFIDLKNYLFNDVINFKHLDGRNIEIKIKDVKISNNVILV